jgi:hypothetical protein
MQNLTEPESRAEAGARRGSFAFGLLWVAFFTAVACGVSSIVELIFVDFIHGNPHRTQSNALVMMALYTPVIAVIGFLGVLLVFTIPQSIQLYILRTLAKFGLREDWLILMLLPLTALCTWYSYEYLTPSDCNLGINTGPDYSACIPGARHGVQPSLRDGPNKQNLKEACPRRKLRSGCHCRYRLGPLPSRATV